MAVATAVALAGSTTPLTGKLLFTSVGRDIVAQMTAYRGPPTNVHRFGPRSIWCRGAAGSRFALQESNGKPNYLSDATALVALHVPFTLLC